MELRTYLQILRRRWWIILVALAATIGAAGIFSFIQPPTYRATATYIVTPTGAYDDMAGFVNVLDAMSRREEIAGTYVEVATSRSIKEQSADELGLSEAQTAGLTVDSRFVPGTNVIEIAVEGRGRQLVGTFANLVGAKTAAYAQELYEAYGLQSLDLATVPESPVSPNKLMNLALGSVLGLALGIGLAFLFEYLDASLRTTEQIETATGLPTFAEIPKAHRQRQRSTYSTSGDPALTEAFLRLRTRILAHEQEKSLDTLLVTSAEPGEGKSTVVAHLALVLARCGRKLVVVDCDLRRPTLHDFFELSNVRGLSDILEQKATLDETLQSTGPTGIHVLSSGQPSSAPAADLLGSSEMRALLGHLTQRFDMVLLDTPSLLAVTDAAVLAPMVDAVLLVVACERVTDTELKTTYGLLNDSHARVAGVVVNRARRDGFSRYHTYYEQTRSRQNRDRLSEISGIGPVYEKILNACGILTFGQLAAENAEDLAKRLGDSIGVDRIIRERWIEQAQSLSKVQQ